MDETLIHTASKPMPYYDAKFAYKDTRGYNYLVYNSLNVDVYEVKTLCERVFGRDE